MAKEKKETVEADTSAEFSADEKPEDNETRETHDVFDAVIKYLLTETSHVTVIYLINALFGRDYDLKSPVSFGKTESVGKYGKTFEFFRSDVIINIGEDSFALEFQIGNDKTIGLRIFEYSFRYAHDTKEVKNYGEVVEIAIPDACVVFFESTRNTPDHITFRLTDKSGTKSFDYEVRVFKMSEQSLKSIEERKLLLLLPFCLIRYRKALERENITEEKMRAIANAERRMLNDLEDILKRSNDSGIISKEDAVLIWESIMLMHEELYQAYSAFKEILMEMKSKTRLRFADYRKEVREELREELREEFQEEKTKIIAEKDKAITKAVTEKEAETVAEMLNLIRQGYSAEELEKKFLKKEEGKQRDVSFD